MYSKSRNGEEDRAAHREPDQERDDDDERREREESRARENDVQEALDSQRVRLAGNHGATRKIRSA